MGSYSKEVSGKLNAILEKVYDAEKGFGKAADNTKAKSLGEWFNDRALDRHRFAIELKREIQAFGEEYTDSGTVTGGAHRAWMDVKALFSQDNDEAMLEEAIRGEKAALEEYSDVLKEQDLPPSTFALLTSQKAQIDYGLATIIMTKDIEFEKK